MGIWSMPMDGQINVKRTVSETNHLIYHSTYSPDGNYVATTGSDNNIMLWNSESGYAIRTLTGLDKRPNRIVFSNKENLLFSADEAGVISCWDWDTIPARISSQFTNHSGAIKALAISKDGSLLASGGEDKLVRVWTLAQDQLQLKYELPGHRKTISSLAFSPDGLSLTSGSADRTLRLWDLRTGANTHEVKAHDGWIRCIRYSPDGSYMATGGDDHLIKFWSTRDLSSQGSLSGHEDWVQTVAFSTSGNQLISGGHDKYICLWDLETRKRVERSEKQEHIVLSVDANPVKNDFISSCLLSEHLKIWAYGSEEVSQMDKIEVDVTPTKSETVKAPVTSSRQPVITLFSPEPVNGEVIHDRASILLIGKADDPDGIQTVLVNRQRVDINSSGVFQLNMELEHGENPVELVAVSYKGNMTRSGFTIRCTDENAKRSVGQQEVQQGKYHALIIAVDDYEDEKITDLDYPISDADSLYRTLVRLYSFNRDEIHFLKNPNRTEMIIAMDELSRSVTTHDNLLIFFAGHGYWDDKSEIGYWLPSDAAKSNTANWFRNSTLRDFIGSIQSRHTLLIADACFSGSIFKTRSAFREESGIQKLHKLPSRKAMTSGYLKEVPDKSVFVKYLIRELNDNKAKHLPSEELFNSFKTTVLNNSPNVPRYGTIQNVGDEGGDFIFRMK